MSNSRDPTDRGIVRTRRLGFIDQTHLDALVMRSMEPAADMLWPAPPLVRLPQHPKLTRAQWRRNVKGK